VTRRPLQQALDEIRFGPTRTLNLRASLPSAAQAVQRTDGWLRAKQLEGAREVLVITGRGNQSYARVPVVREAVRRLLNLLTTRGVVIDHSEHSPGAFAVRLAPATSVRSTSGGARVMPPGDAPRVDPPALDGLSGTTRERLRTLAFATLHALGVRDPSPAFVHDEMARQCAELAKLIPTSASAGEQEERLRAAIERAMNALHDDIR
jgi:hypothetical protein